MSSSADCDVLVIGYGGAGAAAAIEAHDAGAKVLILEKHTSGGGTTAIAGGNIRQVADVDLMTKHFHALGEGTTDLESVEAHVHGLVELPSWIEQLGGVIQIDQHDPHGPRPAGPPFPRETPGTMFPGLVGAAGIGARYRWPKQNGHARGAAGYALLARNVQERGIEVVTGTSAHRLTRSEAFGRVTGAIVEGASGPRIVTASRGIVLASGGFAWDRELVRSTIGAVLPSAAPPHLNTGDGVRMGQSVGAQLWHMSAAVLQLGVQVPAFEATFGLKVRERGFILVDRGAKRFCDESELAGHDGGLLLQDRDLRSAMLRRLPSYLIFDETTRKAGPIVTADRGFHLDSGWSEDNSAEVEAGWIASDTIRDLASKLRLDPVTLSATVDDYNRSIPGADTFGRPDRYRTPFEGGPFYGIAVWPTILNTQGGPRRDPAGRVLDAYGDVIPGLFSAGELGSIFNVLYPGGVNYGEAFVSGRVAGGSAAAG